jgi:transcriptional regulator with XRE-family HTH domain
MVLSAKELGRRLRAAREHAQLTQEEVERKLVLDACAISRIENGTRKLGAIELMMMAQLYGVSTRLLLEDLPQYQLVSARFGELTQLIEAASQEAQRMLTDYPGLTCAAGFSSMCNDLKYARDVAQGLRSYTLHATDENWEVECG